MIEAGALHDAEQEALTITLDYPGNKMGARLYAQCAALRSDWAAALIRWQACSSTCPGEPAFWRVGRAYALLNMDEFEAAAAEFATAFGETGAVAALAGQALAVGNIRPSDAEPLWRQVDVLAADAYNRNWDMPRARALANAGKLDGALAIIENLVESSAPPPGAFSLLGLYLLRARRWPDAERELAHGRLRAGGGASGIDRVLLQASLWHLNDARVGFAAALTKSLTLNDAERMFTILPRLFEPHERNEQWRKLQAHVQRFSDAAQMRTAGLLLRLDLALRDYDVFRERLAGSAAVSPVWERRFRLLDARLAAPAFPDHAAPKIFGIGLSRTGTTSLDAALEKLGLLSAHFLNPFTCEILSEHDFPLFDAANDTPVSARFEALYEQYPNARFILTERPCQSWTTSLSTHFLASFGSADFRVLASRAVRQQGAIPRDHAAIHDKLYYSYATPQDAFDAYHARVAEFFADKPAGKLLRHNVFAGDGWEKLCGFLNLPIPDMPYPRKNRGWG